jgi:hypothetical protein
VARKNENEIFEPVREPEPVQRERPKLIKFGLVPISIRGVKIFGVEIRQIEILPVKMV